MNIGLIHGGYAPNVISDKAEAHILVRLVGPSDETKQSILSTVGNRADVTFSLDLPFVRMRKVGDLPTMIANFTTDIPALTNWGEEIEYEIYGSYTASLMLVSVALAVQLALTSALLFFASEDTSLRARTCWCMEKFRSARVSVPPLLSKCPQRWLS